MARSVGMRRPQPAPPRSHGRLALLMVGAAIVLAVAAGAFANNGAQPNVTPETLYPGTAQQHGPDSYRNALAQAEGQRISPVTNVRVIDGRIYVRHMADATDCADSCAVLVQADGGVELMLPPGYLWYGNYREQDAFDPVRKLTYWSEPDFASLAVERTTLASAAVMPLALERMKISALTPGQTAYIARGSLRLTPTGFAAVADGWAAWTPELHPEFSSTLVLRTRPQKDGSLAVCLPPDTAYLTKADTGLKVTPDTGC